MVCPTPKPPATVNAPVEVDILSIVDKTVAVVLTIKPFFTVKLLLLAIMLPFPRNGWLHSIYLCYFYF